MTRKELRTSESEWRATKHVAHRPQTSKRKRTIGDVLNSIWRWIFA